MGMGVTNSETRETWGDSTQCTGQPGAQNNWYNFDGNSHDFGKIR